MFRFKKTFIRSNHFAPITLLLLLAGAVCFAAPRTAAAQDCATAQQAGINEAIADAGSRKISLKFDIPVTPRDASVVGKESSWFISDITSPNAALDIDQVELEAPDRFSNFLSATLHYNLPLDPSHTYILSVPSLTFNGCKPVKLAFTTVVVPKPVPPGQKPPAPSPFAEAKSTGRADSDIYLNGQLEGAKGESAVKTLDAKIQLPIGISFFRENQDLIPFFEFKVSSNRKADADALKLGVIVRSPFTINTKLLKGIVWDTEGRIEGNKNFKNMNGIWANTVYFLPPVIGQKVQLFTQPFVGFEVGGNLRSPVKEAEHRGIARATAGASVYLNFFTGHGLLDSISLQSDYIRRWPLRGEISFTEDKDKKLIPLFIGTNPRDYVQSKVQFEMSKYFAITIGHEYGSLPPNFKLVDHKYSVGFVYKKRLLYRPK